MWRLSSEGYIQSHGHSGHEGECEGIADKLCNVREVAFWTSPDARDNKVELWMFGIVFHKKEVSPFLVELIPFGFRLAVQIL